MRKISSKILYKGKSPIFEKELNIFPVFSVNSEKISYYNFISIIATPSPENFLIFEMLDNFLNIIVSKEQTTYTPRDVVSGYNSEILWLIIEKNMLPWIKKITKKEISFFIQSEKNFQNNFIDVNVASMCFFQKILSHSQKTFILLHFEEIFSHIFEKIST